MSTPSIHVHQSVLLGEYAAKSPLSTNSCRSARDWRISVKPSTYVYPGSNPGPATTKYQVRASPEGLPGLFRERSARPSAFAALRGSCRSPRRAIPTVGARCLRRGEYAEKYSGAEDDGWGGSLREQDSHAEKVTETVAARRRPLLAHGNGHERVLVVLGGRWLLPAPAAARSRGDLPTLPRPSGCARCQPSSQGTSPHGG
jgi:hypothetical protein